MAAHGSERVTIVSGDGHIGAAPETYRDYIDPEFRDQIDALIAEDAEFRPFTSETRKRLTPEQLATVDVDGAIATGGEYGAWDIPRRIEELDRDGIAVEILHGGHQLSILPFFSVMNSPHPADLRAAGARAYHRWVAECIAQAPDRLVGVADPGTCLDLDETVRELTWQREHGFRSVSLVQQAWNHDLPPVYDAYYEPFYAACEDLGMVLSVHAGWGSPQGKFQEFVKQFLANVVGVDAEDDYFKKEPEKDMVMEAMSSSEESPLVLDMGPRRALWQLMLGGVFDRHPNLKMCLTEVRADWIPATLAVLDARFAVGDTPLRRKPSEYWRDHCFTTPSSIHRCEVDMRYEIGVDQLMFGTDYPHPEGTWPNSTDWARVALAGVPENEVRAILAGNAIRCYGLDAAVVDAIGARIGPLSSDVFGATDLDPALLDHFDTRAGYRRGPEQVDLGIVASLLDEDLGALVG